MAGPIIYHYGGDEGSKANVLAAWGLGSSGTEMLSYGPYPRTGTYKTGRTLSAPFAPYDFDAGASFFDGTGWAEVTWPKDAPTSFWRGASNGLAGFTFSGWYRAGGAASGTVMFVQSDCLSGDDSAGIWYGGQGRGDNLVLGVVTTGSAGAWVHTFTLTLYERGYNSLFWTSGRGPHPRTAIESATGFVTDTGTTPTPIFWAFGRQMPSAGAISTTPRLCFWVDGADYSQPAVGPCTFPNTQIGGGRPMIIIGGDSPNYDGPFPASAPWPFPTTTTSRLTNASVDAVCVWDRILTNGEIDALRAGEPFI